MAISNNTRSHDPKTDKGESKSTAKNVVKKSAKRTVKSAPKSKKVARKSAAEEKLIHTIRKDMQLCIMPVDKTARKYNLKEEELKGMLEYADKQDEEYRKNHIFTDHEEIMLLESIKRKGFLKPLDLDGIFWLAERQFYWDGTRDHVKDPISLEWIEDFLARMNKIEDPWKGIKNPYAF